MDLGVDGYRIDAVPFLFEDSQFLDEPRKPEDLASKEKNTYDQYYHKYTENLPETYDMIAQFREVFDEYTRRDGKTRYSTQVKFKLLFTGYETQMTIKYI